MRLRLGLRRLAQKCPVEFFHLVERGVNEPTINVHLIPMATAEVIPRAGGSEAKPTYCQFEA